MKHEHAEMIRIWADHSELEVEYDNGVGHYKPTDSFCPVWEPGNSYRFTIPNDSEGNPVEVGKEYKIDDSNFEWEVMKINQKTAEILLLYDGPKLNIDNNIKFWESNRLVTVKPKEDKFKDFPGVEFVELLKTMRGAIYYNDGSRVIDLYEAMNNKDFIGYGYELPDGCRIRIISTPVIYWYKNQDPDDGHHPEHLTFNTDTCEENSTPLRPKWVCFRKDEQ